jgi:hypothetical protein
MSVQTVIVENWTVTVHCLDSNGWTVTVENWTVTVQSWTVIVFKIKQ